MTGPLGHFQILLFCGEETKRLTITEDKWKLHVHI